MKHVAVLACYLALAASATAENYLVLPFSNHSGDQNLDWIGESIAETVRESLSAEGLLVLAREDREEVYRRLSIRPYRPMTKASALRVAESLDADTVVFGAFELLPAGDGAAKSRGTLRIRAQAIDMRKFRRGPEYGQLGPLEDLARLQTGLAWQTLGAIIPDRVPSEEQFRQRTPALPVEAIENYTRSLLTPAPEQKLKLLTQAVRLAPDYSHAWFQLGKLQWERKDYRSAGASLAKVQPVDSKYREALFFLGLARYMSGDYTGAQEAFAAVAAEVPLNEVWNNLAAAQLRRNVPEALSNFRKALEGDPADPDYHFNVGLALFRDRQFDAAADAFRAVLERRPDDKDAMLMLGRSMSRPAAPRRGQPAAEISPERLKHTYEESAYLQLKAVLEKKR